MQRTILSYAEAHDRLTGSCLYKDFMDRFDENNDGVIDYDEKGRKGYWTTAFRIIGHAFDLLLTEKYGHLKQWFYYRSNLTLSIPVRIGTAMGMILWGNSSSFGSLFERLTCHGLTL